MTKQLSRRDYAALKRQRPDSLVLVRIGDFYEAQSDDARLIAQICDLALTSVKLDDARIPVVGIPYHSLDRQVADIVSNGYSVVVFDGSKVSTLSPPVCPECLGNKYTWDGLICDCQTEKRGS